MKIKFSCGIQRPRCDVSDGYSWRCRQCKTRKSIREGSFFSKSKLSLQKWLLLIHLWSTDCPVTSVMEQTATDSRTAVDIYQWLREVCSTKLQQIPIILGGQGSIVQIDESLFRHEPKVRLRVEIIIHVYVTRSGKRYHSAQKFKIALAVPLESAERKLYDDANPAFVARSYHVL